MLVFGTRPRPLRCALWSPEALESGTVHLVGTDYDKIMSEVSTLLEDNAAYEKMSRAVNPYGDGHACERIVTFLQNH